MAGNTGSFDKFQITIVKASKMKGLAKPTFSAPSAGTELLKANATVPKEMREVSPSEHSPPSFSIGRRTSA